MPTNAIATTLSGDGEIPLYMAKPASDAKAAIIIIPEIFGLNSGICEKCDAWAKQGYLVAAPDIFWRFAPGEEYDPDIEDQFNKALENMGQYDADQGVKDLAAVIDYLREMGATKVGAVGFCLGGRMAYMMAARTDVDASVGYYGVMIDQMLDESNAIAKPLMLHIPTADHFVGPEAQAAIHAGLDNRDKVTLHDYQGLDHGFAASGGSRRDEAGATLADARTAEFFAAHLA